MAKPALSPDALRQRRTALKAECQDYVPTRGGYGCQHYAGEGACKRNDYFMCVVWLKRNPDEAEEMREAAAAVRRNQTAAASAPNELSSSENVPKGDSPLHRGSMKDQLLERPMSQTRTCTPAVRDADVYDLTRYGVAQDQQRPMLEHPELLTEAAVEAITKLGIEVLVKTNSGVQVALVPEYTSQDRCELTYADARTLVMVLQIFPGATLESLSKPNQEEAS